MSALEEPSQALGLLRSVAETTAAELDLDVVVRRVADLVTAAVGADVCFVHLVDWERQRLTLAGGTPPFDELRGKIELAVGDGIAGWVAQRGVPAVVRDKFADPRYRYIPELRGEDYRLLVSVPLARAGSGVVGVLNVHWRSEDAPAEQAVALLGDTANLLAGAVEHAVLFRRLAERERDLERFAIETVDAQEAERRRVATDVHDGIGQVLVSLWYHLEAAADANPDDPDGVAAELERAKALARTALDEVRATITRLRPRVLDDLGLPAALASLARALPGIASEVDVEDVALDSHVATALYRIGQEALQNVVKHSDATLVRLGLRPRGGAVTLTIEDDGSGFEPTGRDDPGRFGLAGMRERAELVGGSLEVFSRPGDGTRVVCTVPTTVPEPDLGRPGS